MGKPYMDDRSNKVALLDMGKSDVLGLETARKLETQRQEESRSFYIRKPPSLVSDRKDPFNLKDGDTIVLNFNTTVSAESPTEYYDMISEVTRVGTENMTVRTNGDIRREAGLPIDLIDFGIGGIKMDPTDEFMNYILGSDHLSMRIEDKVNTLVNTCYLLNFYPKIRFNRETEIYQPDIPMKIQILSKIVRIESTSGPLYENGNVNTENAQVKDGEYPTITGLGVKFYYDPSEYSRDSFSYDRWDLIRDFKENKHFQEIHTSLNGLIAFIESQNR
ncbi:MAG: hypothetical protein O7G87_16125 [bacterium]|nr:hypothetical protein [bacterium]